MMMGKPIRARRNLIAVAFALGFAAGAHAAPLDGARLYRGSCAGCHGPDARGDGPDAALYDPPPRNLRDGTLKRYPIDELVRRVRTGETLSLLLDSEQLRQRSADVEAVVAHLRRLPDVDWPRAERGEEMWVDRCEVCHGNAGKPPRRLPAGIKHPADLSDGTKLATLDDAALHDLLRHGRKGMPALTPRLSPDDVEALGQYARLFSPGLTIYEKYCAACHGDDGHPGDEIVEGIRRPEVNFDREYFRTHDEELLRLKAWHMVSEQKPSMPHFARVLTVAQVRAVIQYLRRLD